MNNIFEEMKRRNVSSDVPAPLDMAKLIEDAKSAGKLAFVMKDSDGFYWQVRMPVAGRRSE